MRLSAEVYSKISFNTCFSSSVPDETHKNDLFKIKKNYKIQFLV